MGEIAGLPGNFHCPSCRDKRWDRVPPQFPRSSPNVSRSTTPSGRDRSRRGSPSGRAMASAHGSPVASGTPLSGLHGSSGHTSPMDYQPSIRGAGQMLSSQSDKLARARAFLTENGGFPVHQEYSPMLLYRLGDMMTQLESQQRLLQEIHELKEENNRLHNINRELRVHADVRSPHDCGLNPPVPNIPRPSADTSGKSWDRIVMDLL